MKRKALTAPAVAYLMGFTPPATAPNGEPIRYGRKALVGQYTKPYTRVGHLSPRRISKGAQRRYEKTHGTDGTLDYSEVINARR